MNYSFFPALLLQRLERISVDSIWAHRASGVRGALLKTMERLEKGQDVEIPELERLISYGFQILERVAREKS
jgi:hypothetical protein